MCFVVHEISSIVIATFIVNNPISPCFTGNKFTNIFGAFYCCKGSLALF